MRLVRSFFNRHVALVAADLLGKTLVCGKQKVTILETEAYRGSDDAASHAFKGPTPRSSIMFGMPGKSYVYFIYGMYHCFNIVTQEEGSASAVLVRGVQLADESSLYVNGPGRLCRVLHITRDHNAIDLVTNDYLYVEDAPPVSFFYTTPRIGITKNHHKQWRFVTPYPVLFLPCESKRGIVRKNV